MQIMNWCLSNLWRKYHYPLPFTDHILDRVDGNEFYYFVDGSSCYHQFEIDSKDKDRSLVLNWKKCHFMVSFGIVLGHIVLIIVSFFFFVIHVCRKLTLAVPLKSFRCFLNLLLACLFSFLQNIEVNVRFRLGGGIVISCMLVVFPSFFHCVLKQKTKKQTHTHTKSFVWELHVFEALLLTLEWDVCLSQRFDYMSLLKQKKNTLFWSQEPYEVVGC